MSDLKPDLHASIQTLLLREQRILELLLDDRQLAALRARAPKHPAVHRFDTVAHFLNNGCQVTYPLELNTVMIIGKTLLDSLNLSHRAPEDVIHSITDHEVLKQIRRRAIDPGQFSDALAAIHCWSLLNASGLPANLVEQETFPDIAVLDDWIECKHLRSTSNLSRVRKLVCKANNQIKKANPTGAGILYLYVEQRNDRLAVDDTLPNIVEACASEMDKEFRSGRNRSVASVILQWDEFTLLGDPPCPTMYFFTRRALIRHHRNPRRRLNLPDKALEIGRTVCLPITWGGPKDQQGEYALPPINLENITVTELFRKECEVPGYVRSVHAVEAVRRPDGISFDYVDDMAMILLTKWIGIAAKPYMLLIVASRRGDGPTEIIAGFRLYRGQGGLEKGTHPHDVFKQLLDRYGLTVRVGARQGIFFSRVRVTLQSTNMHKLVEVLCPPDEAVFLATLIKSEDTTPRSAIVAWAFAIATARYRADLMAHGFR